MIVANPEDAEGGGGGKRTDTSAPPRGPEDNGGPASPVENSSERTGPSQAPTECPPADTAVFEPPEYGEERFGTRFALCLRDCLADAFIGLDSVT